MARLKVKYTEEIAPALMSKFQYKSVMQIPKLSISKRAKKKEGYTE